MTPESLPIVEPHPADERLVLAAGHGQLRIALSPITGRLVADLITAKDVDADLAPFQADRFKRLLTA